MVNCCCSNMGAACLECPNSMSGVGDRYPGPYFKDYTDIVYGPVKMPEAITDWYELLKKPSKAPNKSQDKGQKKSGSSAHNFGGRYMNEMFGQYEEDPVCPI